jgi:hypothetical protein
MTAAAVNRCPGLGHRNRTAKMPRSKEKGEMANDRKGKTSRQEAKGKGEMTKAVETDEVRCQISEARIQRSGVWHLGALGVLGGCRFCRRGRD